MNLESLDEYAVSLFLHLVRVGSFLAVVPFFGRQVDSQFARLVLAVSFGTIFWWVGEQAVEPPSGLMEMGVMAIREGVVGLALGFAMSTLTSMLVSAGEIISSEMGFSLARTMNPESGTDATVFSQLLQVRGMILILQFDLHHEALRIVGETFEACPVGRPYDVEPIWLGLRTLVSGSVAMALQYAFPVLGIMMLMSIGMVLLGRAVPAINLMEFGFALRVIAAMAVTAFFLVESAPFLLNVFRAFLDQSRALFGG